MLKDKLKELIAIVEESNVHEVEVSYWWGRKIRVAKTISNPALGFPHASVHAGAQVSAENAGEGQTELAAAGSAESGSVKDISHYHQICAPIVGTFYRAPSPESTPYVKKGEKVSSGQVVCIIEAMKIMNEIESDVAGTVVDIMVDNASPVEFNQPLVIVDPG